MKVQKIVSLDVETAQIAQNMANFSLFVRNQLHATKSEDSITDMQNRIAVYVKAFRTLIKDVDNAGVVLDAHYHTDRPISAGELEGYYIKQAKEELFQSKLGDY